MLSINSLFVTALEEMRWCPFCGTAQANFSLLVIEPEGKKQEEDKKEEEDKRAEGDMVSTIAFTQANLQHSITASRVLIRIETWH